MLTVNATSVNYEYFSLPIRLWLAGSSQSGKTSFAKRICENARDIFGKEFGMIHYYYPIYLHDHCDWHRSLNVTYHIGLPTLDELMNMDSGSCLIFDDIIDKITKSETIDRLFRVLSGKRNLSVMVMTQNHFAKGVYSRSIRNSCNYIALFRNCADKTINQMVARQLALTKALDKAQVYLEGKSHPYIFIDQTQQGQATGLRLYIDIFSRFKNVISDKGMPSYVLNETDFKNFFKIICSNGSSITATEKDAASSSDDSDPPGGSISKKTSKKSRKECTQKLKLDAIKEKLAQRKRNRERKY